MAALTPEEIDLLPTYTNAQLIKLIDKQIADILLGGQEYRLNERNMVKARLDHLREWRAELVTAIEDETAEDDGGGIVLVQYGERV